MHSSYLRGGSASWVFPKPSACCPRWRDNSRRHQTVLVAGKLESGMTRWTYEEVKVIGMDRDKYRDLIRELSRKECFGSNCGSCLICRAKTIVLADAERDGYSINDF